jgi:hypothetical protein
VGVEGIWRRIRSLLGSEPSLPRSEAASNGTPEDRTESTDAAVAGRYVPTLPMTPGYQPETEQVRTVPAEPEVSTASSAYSVEAPGVSDSATPSLEELAQSLSERLVEDESLRGNLTDEEFQPLLDWAMKRIGDLVTALGGMPPAQAAAKLRRAGEQIRDLLRVIDVAVGERTSATSEVAVSRLQMLDTLLQPPLVEPQAAALSRARLDAILAEPPARLQAMDGPELTRRLAGVLE